MSLVEVRDLRVVFGSQGTDIVDEVSFAVDEGKVLALVGESGSGKTTVATALLGYSRGGARIDGGSILIDGHEVVGLGRRELRDLRGRVVAYVPQDPSAALNPALRLRVQLAEGLAAHVPDLSSEERLKRVRTELVGVGLPDTDEFLSRFPHQLSGGQRQRVCIAMTFVLRPKVIVMDEPTTGLDVTTQARVLETVRDLCVSRKIAAVYVTHDLAVVAELADDVLVMYAGRVAELGPRSEIFASPRHPYTQKLLATIPELEEKRALVAIPGSAPSPGRRPAGCFFAPRCDMATELCSTPPPLKAVAAGHDVRCVLDETPALPVQQRLRSSSSKLAAPGPALLVADSVVASYGGSRALHGVSLQVGAGECVALVGESGSGKSTLSRCLIGLMGPDSGSVSLGGATLEPLARQRSREHRQKMQYIFQSPFDSLNPRKLIRDSIGLPLRQVFGIRGHQADAEIARALERVSLTPTVANRYPHELSGGERQRVAIARALVCQPSVLLCDEITSALDVSVQASIVQLLAELQAESDLGVLFVTHNLALVRSIADRVVVLRQGAIVEEGTVEQIVVSPTHEYTRQLLRDTPSMAGAGEPANRKPTQHALSAATDSAGLGGKQ